MVNVLPIVISTPIAVRVAVVGTFDQIVNLIRSIGVRAFSCRRGGGVAIAGVRAIIGAVKLFLRRPYDVPTISETGHIDGNVHTGNDVYNVAVDLVIVG